MEKNVDMSITILTGLPGSGKSETLITRVRTALQEGRMARTFMCGDSPVLRSRPNLAVRRVMSCRAGLRTSLDHFVSTENCMDLLADAPPGALMAFDEAQYFGHQVVESWCAAAARGVEILIATPSVAQLRELNRRGHEATQLQLTCQECHERAASNFYCHLHDDRTVSVCDACSKRLQAHAKADVVDLLRRNGPQPGKECIYQPIELPECRGWDVLRGDSRRRFEIMRDKCTREGLPGVHSTFLDVGCNTGFFCHQMYRAGFRSTGVDVTARDIEVARLLGTYFRRDFATYVVSDAHEYLKAAPDGIFDVTAAFSVFQWVMIQKTPEHGLECMRWLFGKTARVCILEMGESTEAHYIERIGMRYDSAWIYGFMQTHGGFERIELVDGRANKLKRDLLVGYKRSPSGTDR